MPSLFFTTICQLFLEIPENEQKCMTNLITKGRDEPGKKQVWRSSHYLYSDHGADIMSNLLLFVNLSEPHVSHPHNAQNQPHTIPEISQNHHPG